MIQTNTRATVWLCVLLAACSTETSKPVDFYESPLFHDVQTQAVFPDSKTFVDCLPKGELSTILSTYDRDKGKADFDLAEFVRANFEMPVRPESGFKTDSSLTMDQHLERLWPVLTRQRDTHEPHSSLIPLPNSYVVPGGRFSEIYYWDSYFTMLGLRVQGRNDLIKNMVDNFAFLIDSIGFIPNGNRRYYQGRSQPPFFSVMVRDLAAGDSAVMLSYLNQMEKEYAFWMDGEAEARVGAPVNHVVRLDEHVVLNRYYDRYGTPRPEAYKEDHALAQKSSRPSDELCRDLRAAAESGIDFSSRWFEPGKGLESIRTTRYVAVDLNSLLYHLEGMLSMANQYAGNSARATYYKNRAESRKQGILKYCWNAEAGFFFDYDFTTSAQSRQKALAAAYPLFFSVADPEQAHRVAQVLKREFLKPGGMVTSLEETGEQWDAPNGWAPLQWMVYRGLMNYGEEELAIDMRRRWLRLNMRVFEATGKMMEKYNVADTTLLGGGGEYPNQDGFGWTNGVALAFWAEEKER